MNRLLIEWCDRIKYLDVYLANAKSVKFDINPMKDPFMLPVTPYSHTVKVQMN